jgi:hypothetical protein
MKQRNFLSPYEASQKYPLSVSHIRRLLRQCKLDGWQVEVNSRSTIWLVTIASLKKYTSQEHKPGRKPLSK